MAQLIPSNADLYLELHKAFTDSVRKPWLGEINIEFCEPGMQRVIAFRDAGNDHRFFDVRFEEFQRDPFASIQGLYRFLGEELSDEARAEWRRGERTLRATSTVFAVTIPPTTAWIAMRCASSSPFMASASGSSTAPFEI